MREHRSIYSRNVACTSFTLAAALLCIGCATIDLLPGAETVVITKTPADVVNCKIIGKGVWGEANTASRNEAANNVFMRGGDTFLITSADPIFSTKYGVIYNCRGVDSRQPVPVQPK